MLYMRRIGSIGLMLALAGTGALVAGTGAYGVPASNRIVVGELELSTGTIVKFAVLEGAMLTVKELEGEHYIGYVPRIVDESGLEVDFAVFEITEMGEGNEAVRYLERFGVNGAGFTAATSGVVAEHTGVKVTQIAKSRLSDEDVKMIQKQLVPRVDFGSEPTATAAGVPPVVPMAGTCCVTCEDIRVCGCSVEHSCGSCCESPCCGGSTPGPPDQQW
ncbi:MAG: hypothetical protein GY856_45720 [bacterium]|nr:hypothetical protein [bacterium]